MGADDLFQALASERRDNRLCDSFGCCLASRFLLVLRGEGLFPLSAIGHGLLVHLLTPSNEKGPRLASVAWFG
jgi:hypothetical protein